MADVIRKIARYGWHPSLPSGAPHFQVAPQIGLPSHVNLATSLHMPPVWDQGDLGSCTAHGCGAAFEFDLRRQGVTDFTPSRLFLYYNERTLENTVASDSGAAVADGIQAMREWGLPPESEWPYDISKFTDRPPDQAFTDAAAHKAVLAQQLFPTLYNIKAVLAQGLPVVFGFTVYENFETRTVARTGLVPMPQGSSIGGHCVLACGYNSHNLIMCRNSWGVGWGDPDFPGYFWMPPEYVTNAGLAADFWVLQAIS